MAADTTPSPSPTLADDDDSIIVAALSVEGLPALSEIESTSSEDPDFKLIRDWVQTSWPSKKQLSASLLAYFRCREQLSVHRSMLFRGENLVVPSALRQHVLQLLHSGHPGIVRMKQKYNSAYFWPGGSKDIESFVANCHACSATGKNVKNTTVPVTAIPPSSHHWQKAVIDITGPFATAPKHQRHVVVIIDYFSKYPEVLLTDSVTSSRVLRKCLRYMEISRN